MWVSKEAFQLLGLKTNTLQRGGSKRAWEWGNAVSWQLRKDGQEHFSGVGCMMDLWMAVRDNWEAYECLQPWYRLFSRWLSALSEESLVGGQTTYADVFEAEDRGYRMPLEVK